MDDEADQYKTSRKLWEVATTTNSEECIRQVLIKHDTAIIRKAKAEGKKYVIDIVKQKLLYENGKLASFATLEAEIDAELSKESNAGQEKSFSSEENLGKECGCDGTKHNIGAHYSPPAPKPSEVCTCVGKWSGKEREWDDEHAPYCPLSKRNQAQSKPTPSNSGEAAPAQTERAKDEIERIASEAYLKFWNKGEEQTHNDWGIEKELWMFAVEFALKQKPFVFTPALLASAASRPDVQAAVCENLFSDKVLIDKLYDQGKPAMQYENFTAVFFQAAKFLRSREEANKQSDERRG